MKKLFTLVCALMTFGGVANAATVDEIEPLKHSYVLVCDELGARPGKGVLFGANHFLDVTGGTTATNKGSIDLSQVSTDAISGDMVTEDIVNKYAEYGNHMNFLRLKNDQDVIAMKVTAGSKIIIFYNANNKGAEPSRYPYFGVTNKPTTEANNPIKQGAIIGYNNGSARYEWIADDDRTVYIGGKGGDQFISFIIVEANEAPGTPTVKLGEQTFENGLWFREVSAKANDYKMEGSDDAIPTIITYTTDGSTPNASSPVYTEPIKCYKDMTVKFQAYQDWNMGADEGFICNGADNEANVSFSFNAPAINADGANVTIVSEYENAKNFVTLDGNLESAEERSEFTLESSATVTAYSTIKNGEYATFTTKTSSKEVYVLSPIKAKQTLTVTGDIVPNPDKAADTDPNFIVENGKVNATNEECFFIRKTSFKVVEEAEYQVPVGQQAYLQMSDDIITFEVAEGDSVDVVVTCSKNSCKTITLTDDEVDAEGSKVANDRKCFINVDGTIYSALDENGNEAADLKRNPNANIVKFGLKAGIHTFKKYSGTGNILVSSIEITPAEKTVTAIETVKAAADQNAPAYNLAGQKVNKNYKGIVIQNGKKIAVK